MDMRANARLKFVKGTSLVVNGPLQKPYSATVQVEAKKLMVLGTLSEKTSRVKFGRPEFVMKFRKKARFWLVSEKILLAIEKGLLNDRLFPKISFRLFFLNNDHK